MPEILFQGITSGKVRALSTIYGHAARYFHRLGKLSTRITDWGDVPTHDEYVAQLRERHPRSSAFWKRVDPS